MTLLSPLRVCVWWNALLMPIFSWKFAAFGFINHVVGMIRMVSVAAEVGNHNRGNGV